MSENNTKIDVPALVDSLVDGMVNHDIRKAAAETNDPFLIGAIELFIEYGITGQKLVEFMNKFQCLFKLKESLPKNEDGDT